MFAKQTYLFSILFYLLSGNDNFTEKLREKSEKIVHKKRQLSYRKLSFLFGFRVRNRCHEDFPYFVPVSFFVQTLL